MNLQVRILLMVTSLLAATVMLTTAVLAWGARRLTLAHIEADGILIGQMLAKWRNFQTRLPRRRRLKRSVI
ncbi:MAG: hypothetical protein HC881_21140 [Leptolyngbyaceae cyanobacterium SL_7_1]|nr:hypothetical protein [Leptolyngbyaceae cyanobacterium SL_7_1]